MDESIENILCDAIEILAQAAANSVQPDRTIEATIVSCVDRETLQITQRNTGYYQLKYQDAYIYASNNNPLIIYPRGSRVYVQVISGEMSSSKMILGPVDEDNSSTTFLDSLNNDNINLRNDLQTNYFKKTQNDDQMPEFVENQTYFSKNINMTNKAELNVHGTINITNKQDEEDAGNLNIGHDLNVTNNTSLTGTLEVGAAATFKDDVQMDTNLAVAKNLTTNLLTFDTKQATLIQDNEGFICVKHPRKLAIEEANLRIATTEYAKSAGTKPNTLQIGGIGTNIKWMYTRSFHFPQYIQQETEIDNKKIKKYYIMINGEKVEYTASTKLSESVKSITVAAPEFMKEKPDVVLLTLRKSPLEKIKEVGSSEINSTPCLLSWDWRESSIGQDGKQVSSAIIIKLYGFVSNIDVAYSGIPKRYIEEDGSIQKQGIEEAVRINFTNSKVAAISRSLLAFDMLCIKYTDAENTDYTTDIVYQTEENKQTDKQE